ncbi:MAG: hypothetical protein AAF763_02650 [Pseudomonadota bacterium]
MALVQIGSELQGFSAPAILRIEVTGDGALVGSVDIAAALSASAMPLPVAQVGFVQPREGGVPDSGPEAELSPEFSLDPADAYAFLRRCRCRARAFARSA